MKRYTTYRTTAAALLLLTLLFSACSADEVVESNNRDGEIRFCVGDNDKWITRAALVSSSNIKSQKISLTAVFDNNTSTNYLDNKPLTYQSSSWELDTKYYWPPANLSFYARLPYDDSNMSDATFGASPSFKYTTPENSTAHHDLMYAVIKNQTKTDDVMTLHMKHALAAITFLAKTESSSMTVKVSGIDFCNVKTKGTFTYPSTSTTSSSSDNHANYWTSLNTVSTLKMSNAIELNNTTEQQVNTDNGVMMLIPQTLTAWNQNSNALEQSGSYVVIHCSMKFNGAYIVGGESDTNGLIYVPYGGTFDAGYHYKTSMTFGLGYGADGKTLKPKVTLTASIVDWTTEVDNNDDKPIYPN